MIHYRQGKVRDFFMKYDWNRLFQEISTILISLGIGLYFYEKKSFPGMFKSLQGKGIPGEGLFAETSRPYLVFGIVVICCCLLLKVSIYCSFFDANTLKSAKFGKKRKKFGMIDINGILNEISTVLLGITVGLFSTPVVQNAVIFEKAEYPDPTLGVILTLLCLVFKILLYSEALNFQSKGIWQPQKIKPFLGKYDWNEFFQEFTSTCIGIGIGFYLYESRVIFLPAKWFPGAFSDAEKESAGIVKKVTQIFENTPFEKAFKAIPDIWNNEAAQPYIVAGIAILIICVLLKIAIYLALWDANQLRDFLLGNRGRNRSCHRDINGIVDEIATIALTAIAGVVMTPLFESIFTEKQQGDSSYQLLLLCLLLPLAWLKLMTATGGLEFGKVKAVSRRPPRGKRRR